MLFLTLSAPYQFEDAMLVLVPLKNRGLNEREPNDWIWLLLPNLI
jgi:hypothetical protein